MFLECISDVENVVTITANKQPPLGNISTLLVEEIKEWEWDWGQVYCTTYMLLCCSQDERDFPLVLGGPIPKFPIKVGGKACKTEL